jgi:hypothetical protein
MMVEQTPSPELLTAGSFCRVVDSLGTYGMNRVASAGRLHRPNNILFNGVGGSRTYIDFRVHRPINGNVDRVFEGVGEAFHFAEFACCSLLEETVIGAFMDSDARTPNGFLASLDEDDFESLRPHLRTVALTQSEQLVKIGDPINHVFLPHSGIISLVVELDQGERVEVAMIGRDSVLNLSGVLAGSTAVTNAIVMLPGVASILNVDQLRMEAERRPALRGLVAGHGMAIFVQA